MTFVDVNVADLRDCPHCKRLVCSGSYLDCPGLIFDICASMELAERERDQQRELDLMRLRDRPDLWRSRHTPKDTRA